MKKCDCKNFRELIIENHTLKDVQDWNFCVFCGKEMKEE